MLVPNSAECEYHFREMRKNNYLFGYEEVFLFLVIKQNKLKGVFKKMRKLITLTNFQTGTTKNFITGEVRKVDEADEKKRTELIAKDIAELHNIGVENLLREEEEKRKANVIPNGLNPKYTFDDFVVGKGNRFAHAACIAVAQSPAKAYNPLFIYGEDASEKTHLMQAIGNYITHQDNNTKILYISGEKFINELINAIKDGRTVAFRDKYRSVDVLLIEDMQFITIDQRAQEEFFHIFNTLHESNKQIVITSDRPPKDITNLEERLISRFEWGLVTDIQPPDFETRIAILRKKGQAENLNAPDEVINFIAEKICSNSRQLEGALTKLVVFSTFNKKGLSVSLARAVLKNIIPLEDKPEEVK